MPILASKIQMLQMIHLQCLFVAIMQNGRKMVAKYFASTNGRIMAANGCKWLQNEWPDQNTLISRWPMKATFVWLVKWCKISLPKWMILASHFQKKSLSSWTALLRANNFSRILKQITCNCRLQFATCNLQVKVPILHARRWSKRETEKKKINDRDDFWQLQKMPSAKTNKPTNR